jgi:hypothetical protein
VGVGIGTIALPVLVVTVALSVVFVESTSDVIVDVGFSVSEALVFVEISVVVLSFEVL